MKTVDLSLRVKSRFFNPGDVSLLKSYKNIVESGSYITYELNPLSNPNIQPYLQKLIIRVNTFIGDADIFVSLTNPNPSIADSDYSSITAFPVD